VSERCQLCSQYAQADAALCWRHVDALFDLLDPDNTGRPDEDVAASIPNLYALLDPTPGGGGALDERRPPGFHSAPAASLHVLAMTDDRSVNDPQVWFPSDHRGEPDWTRPHTEEPSPPRAVRRALEGLVDSLAEEWGVPIPALGAKLRDVEPLAGWLYLHRARLAASEDAGEIFRDLLELSDQLRRAVGDAPLGPAGRCIELVRDPHGSDRRECGGPLVLLPPTPDPPGQTKEAAQRAEVARCPRCHRRYSWLDLIRIRYLSEPDA